MQTIEILKIEKNLNKKIRREAVSIGFDVAERFTGICILKTDNSKIYIEDLQIIETNKRDDALHRADSYVNSLGKFKQDLEKYKEFKILTIEDCYFGQNVETLKHLARFSILTYRELKKNTDAIYLLMPNTARSIIGFNQKNQEKITTITAGVYTRDTKDKKGKIKHRKGEKKKIDCKSLVHDYLKTGFGIEIKNKDEADAFVLALAGLLK